MSSCLAAVRSIRPRHRNLVVLTDALVHRYGKHAGLGARELINTVLPALKQADLIDYQVALDGSIANLDEFIGVSATVTEQSVRLLNVLQPQRSDLAFLHSVEIGALAPLGEPQPLAGDRLFGLYYEVHPRAGAPASRDGCPGRGSLVTGG